MKLQILFLIAFFAISIPSFSKVGPGEIRDKIIKRITCELSLVSHWIQERGYDKEIKITYGGYTFLRTDVGDSDGILKILNRGNKEICNLPLSLVTDIYFSSKDTLLALNSYSGSAQFIEAFEINQEGCRLIGKYDYTLDSKFVDIFFNKKKSLKNCEKAD
jgi:hypothetical protein